MKRVNFFTRYAILPGKEASLGKKCDAPTCRSFFTEHARRRPQFLPRAFSEESASQRPTSRTSGSGQLHADRRHHAAWRKRIRARSMAWQRSLVPRRRLGGGAPRRILRAGDDRLG